MAWLTQQLSSKAYRDSPDLSDVPNRKRWVRSGAVPAADRVRLVETFSKRKFQVDVQGFVARNAAGLIFVAFRGTEEGKISDVNTSTHSKRVKHKDGCKLHAGY
ncbi:MAG: hypothetical protein MI919_00430, partial [Holophagales bacterium]|nr:hypothetical protein [Holophagales bacterium]